MEEEKSKGVDSFCLNNPKIYNSLICITTKIRFYFIIGK